MKSRYIIPMEMKGFNPSNLSKLELERIKYGF